MFTQLTQYIDESPMKKSFMFKCYRNKKELIILDDQQEIDELLRIADEFDFQSPVEINGKTMHIFIRAEDWQDHNQDMEWRTQFASDMLDDDWANEFFYKFRVPEGGFLSQIRTAVMQLGLPNYKSVSEAYERTIASADRPLPPGYSVLPEAEEQKPPSTEYFRSPEAELAFWALVGEGNERLKGLGLKRIHFHDPAKADEWLAEKLPMAQGNAVVEEALRDVHADLTATVDEDLERAVTDNAVLQQQAEERLPEIDTPPDEGDDNFGNYAEDNDKD